MYGPYNRSFVALPELKYVQFIKICSVVIMSAFLERKIR